MQVLTLSILVVLCIGAVVRPSWAIVLVLLMYSLEQALQGSVPMFLSWPPLANYIVAIATGLATVHAVFRQERPFVGYFNSVWVGFTVLLIWAAASLMWTPSFEAASKLTRDSLPYIFLFFFCAPLLIDRTQDFGPIVKLYLVFGILVAISIIANPAFDLRSGRLGFRIATGVRSSPLAIGELGGVLMITSALIYSGIRTSVWTILRLVGFACGTALALYSGSRGQVLFGGLIAIAFYPISKPVKNLVTFLTTALGFVVLTLVVYFAARLVLGTGDLTMVTRWDATSLEGGASVRMQNFLDLFLAFAASPVAWVLGLGINAFSSVSLASTEPYSHSIFLDALCELGVPAFIVLCICVQRSYAASRQLFANHAGNPFERASLAVFIAMAAYQVLLVNKQGMLWSAGPFYLHLVILNRVLTREQVLATDFVDESNETAIHEEGECATVA